ncbi:MAG: hypothetical protein Q9161_005344 [Pseudevernia consocians]
MEGFVMRRTRPNPDRLHDDHFIDWLPEAKQLYQIERPPFVEKNQGSSRAGLRKNVTLRVTEDQQQGLPVEAELICWSWSPQYTFFTIDIGGRRLIVKGNSSDRYCSKEPEDSEGPNIDLKTQHANHVQRLSITPCPGSPAKPDSRAPQTRMKNQYIPQPEWRPSNFPPRHPLNQSSARSTSLNMEHPVRQQYAQEQQQYVDIKHTAQAGSPSIKNSPRSIKARSSDCQVSPTTVHSDKQHHVQPQTERAPSSGPRHDASLPKGCEEHSPNGPLDSAQIPPSQGIPKVSPESQDGQGLASKPNEDTVIATERQQHASAERTGESVVSKKPYGNSADAPTPHGRQYQGQGSAETNPLARPKKRRRRISIPNSLNPTSPQLSTAIRSPSARSSSRPTPSTSSQDHSRFSTPPSLNPQSTDSSSSLLASHKQSHTTLFIAIPLSTDTVPLKLRSCMTLSSFFTSVLAICAQPGQDVVSGIRATFDWKLDKDFDRAILLKQDFPDTFEVFLEIVDGAPCWGEQGGRCGVGVEVVLV